MKPKIYLLTDYKNYFGSKQGGIPYRSGLDQSLLESLFAKNNIAVEYINMSESIRRVDLKDQLVLYTSSEDVAYHYKSFIEDVVFHHHQSGAKLVPDYDFLRANNNKVFMELYRKRNGHKWGDSLNSWVFGTYEEMLSCIDEFTYPIVIKTASGAMSRGVKLASSKEELKKKVKEISKTNYFVNDLKDHLRTYKHKDYLKNSVFRSKFILQSFIPNLKNDWKILIYGDKYFILTRHVRKNDFRASGSHENYLPGSESLLPNGLLDFAKQVYDSMDVPNLSLDVVYDGSNFHLVEFQGVYFGTSTILMSDVYFTPKSDQWVQEPIKQSIEELYVESVVLYINKNS